MAASTTTYTLDQYKDDKQKELERKKNAAIQEANVSAQKLQKYLQPSEAMARKGYSQGMTETAMIAADNSRQRAIAAAENDYSAAHTELLNQYRTEKKAESDALYNDILSTIESGEWNTTADLENYINQNSEGLTDFQKQQLQNKLNFYKGNPDQQAAEDLMRGVYVMDPDEISEVDYDAVRAASTDEAWDAAANNQRNGDFEITIGDEDYDVEFGEGVVLPHDFLKKVNDGGLIIVDGKLHIRMGNRFFIVNSRDGNNNTAHYKALIKAVKGQTEKE